MKKVGLLVGVFVCGLAVTTCGDKKSESLTGLCLDFCDKLEECGLDDADECAEDCESDAEDATAACEDASKDFLSCVVDMSCNDLEAAFTQFDFGSCEDEAIEAGQDCEEDDDDDVECCASGDPCDYADDGFCDCADQSWDAADCN